MDDRDFYVVAAMILALAGIGILQGRVLKRHDNDIRYLMDNTVSRETEARPR